MSYNTKNIRNIALLGHGNSGKTTLAESMLYTTGAIDRQGKVTDGNTVCDYDPEEVRRQITISMSMAPVIFKDTKINVLDCPGYQDFVGEAIGAIAAAEAGLILCTAKDGLSVGAERSWKLLEKANKPVMFYISKLNEEHSDYAGTLAQIKGKYGSIVCPVFAPLSSGNGVIDLVHNKAYITENGKTMVGSIPAEDAGTAEELRAELMEAAAGATEELMDKFFENMELDESDIVKGLQAGVRDRSVVPVFCGSADSGIGTEALLSAIVDYVPEPHSEVGTETDPVVLYVFKTVSDQFGKYSLVKVLSGKLAGDQQLRNVRTGSTDRLGRLYVMTGKKNAEVKEAPTGISSPLEKWTGRPAIPSATRRRKWSSRFLIFRHLATAWPLRRRPAARMTRSPQALRNSMRKIRPSVWKTTVKLSKWSSPVPVTCSWTFSAPSSRVVSASRRS